LTEERQLTVLCLASYEKGQEFMRECKRQGCRVLLVTTEKLRDANWPRESVDEFFYMPPDFALDALTRRRMHAFLLDIWQRTRTTIVFVTHDIGEAVALADRICVMSPGPRARIVQVLPVDLPRPRDPTDPQAAQLFKRVEALLA